MKKVLVLMAVGIMLMIPVIVNAAFPDVASTHWAAGYIEELTNKGVINGYEDGTFRPGNTLTKGEFLKLIMAASIQDFDFTISPRNFNHWAAGYVKVAENYWVLESGEITLENINEPIKRIDVIRILSLCDINVRRNPQKSVSMLNFNDVQDLTIEEKVLLGHAVANGIINGYEDGTFRPNNNLTRAEVTKILSIYMSK